MLLAFCIISSCVLSFLVGFWIYCKVANRSILLWSLILKVSYCCISQGIDIDVILDSSDKNGTWVKLKFVCCPAKPIFPNLSNAHWLIFPQFSLPSLKPPPAFNVKLLSQSDCVLTKDIFFGLIEWRHYAPDLAIDFNIFRIKVIIGLVIVLLECKGNRKEKKNDQ